MTLMHSVSASCFPANHGKTSSSQDGTVRSDAANQGAAAELRRSTSRLAAVKWRGSALMKVKSRHRGLLRLNFSPQGWSLFLGVADKHKVRGQRSFLWLSSWNICLNLTKLYFFSLEVVCSCNLVKRIQGESNLLSHMSPCTSNGKGLWVNPAWKLWSFLSCFFSSVNSEVMLKPWPLYCRASFLTYNSNITGIATLV